MLLVRNINTNTHVHTLTHVHLYTLIHVTSNSTAPAVACQVGRLLPSLTSYDNNDGYLCSLIRLFGSVFPLAAVVCRVSPRDKTAGPCSRPRQVKHCRGIMTLCARITHNGNV